MEYSFSLVSERFGEVGIDVEEGKKENRSLATFHFKLQDFISRYKNEDIYMVESLPLKMRGIIDTNLFNNPTDSFHPPSSLNSSLVSYAFFLKKHTPHSWESWGSQSQMTLCVYNYD